MSSPRWGRSPPARRAPGRAGRGPAPPRRERTPARQAARGAATPTITVGVTPSRPGRHGHVGSGPGAGRYHHRQRARRAGGAGDRAAGPVRRWLRRRGRRRRRDATISCRSRSDCSTTPRGWCRSPARGWPPAKRWWSRRHDRHPAHPHRATRGRGRQRLATRRCRGAGARRGRRDQELSRRAARPGPARGEPHHRPRGSWSGSSAPRGRARPPCCS